jgi:hypothetical protein
MKEEILKISERDGYTTIDTVVYLHDGLCLRPSGMIHKECMEYS